MLAGLAAAQIDVSGNSDDSVVAKETVTITPGPSLNLTDEEIANLGDPGDLRRIDKRQDPVIADIQPGTPENLTEEEIASQGEPGDLRRIGRRGGMVVVVARAESSEKEEEEEEGGDEDREHPQIGGGRGSRKERRAPQDEAGSQTVDVADLVAGSGNATDPSQIEAGQTRRINWPKKDKREEEENDDDGTQTVNVGDLGSVNSTDPSSVDGSDTRRIHNHASRMAALPVEKREGAAAEESQAGGAGGKVGGSRGGRLPVGRRMRFGRRQNDQ
ncbi:hypothetical protein MPH_04244 [Macrophomina phaseolina MS6]|uniref:Uncharacterized protein n=1 Tax=Macrophomina phaseolina (strain MS6) TaxID=1126212 RepID=K2S0F2_MACPH|nr:hypothetical protein MPH_04244 [Macrophomina phaseolina MS6]